MSQDNEQPAEDRSPEQIRAEIEETRGEMGETVAAVAAKTDVKARAQKKAEEAKAAAKELGNEAKAAAPASPAEGARQVRRLATENPKPLTIAGAVMALAILWRLLRR